MQVSKGKVFRNIMGHRHVIINNGKRRTITQEKKNAGEHFRKAACSFLLNYYIIIKHMQIRSCVL